MFDNKTILITGGTGSFGQKCVEKLLNESSLKKLIVFSRDEYKQHQMQQRFPEKEYPILRFFLGDVRDERRLRRAFDGVDYVIHAAALKQIPALEYNPFEAVQTNIIGSQNVISAAIDARVGKVLLISSDKAVHPVNLYGSTKLCAEKLFIAGNAYSPGKTKFSAVRYGNVIGSRGSVIGVFRKCAELGHPFPLTDERMTRFWITLEQGVDFVLARLQEMEGQEIFVPKIPSMKIVDLVHAMVDETEQILTGIRPGEKLHETLISSEETRRTFDHNGGYVIEPYELPLPYIPMEEYRSDNNEQWLSVEELREVIEKLEG